MSLPSALLKSTSASTTASTTSVDLLEQTTNVLTLEPNAMLKTQSPISVYSISTWFFPSTTQAEYYSGRNYTVKEVTVEANTIVQDKAEEENN